MFIGCAEWVWGLLFVHWFGAWNMACNNTASVLQGLVRQMLMLRFTLLLAALWWVATHVNSSPPPPPPPPSY